MQGRFFGEMNREGFLKGAGACLAAVSGGADSMALLSLLAKYCKRERIPLFVLHVHHGLREEEADRDARFVEGYCSKRDIPFLLRYADVSGRREKTGESKEAAARALRYALLSEAAQTLEEEGLAPVRIAVGHHLEDNAETVLLNLARGSGLRGLSGIASRRGRIIRPLLGFKKEELLQYLEKEGIPYVTDSSNRTSEFTRNRLRHDILPLLGRRVNERAAEHIADAAKILSMAGTYLEKEAASLYEEKRQQEQIREEDGGIVLSAVFLRNEAPIIRHLFWNRLLSRLYQKEQDIYGPHIRDLEKLLFASGTKFLDLPGGVAVKKEYDRFFFGSPSQGRKAPPSDENLRGAFAFRLFPYNGEAIPEEPHKKWFDYDALGRMPDAGFRRPGLFIRIRGGRKKLKDLLIDEKIPAGDRGRIPLLFLDNELVWIVGHRIGEGFKVGRATKRILEVEYKGEGL